MYINILYIYKFRKAYCSIALCKSQCAASIAKHFHTFECKPNGDSTARNKSVRIEHKKSITL